MFTKYFAPRDDPDPCGMCGRTEKGDDCPFCLPVDLECEANESHVDPDDGRYSQFDFDLYDRDQR